MITLIAHFVIFSSKKINRLKPIFVFFFLFWAAFCTVLTAQKPGFAGFRLSAPFLHSLTAHFGTRFARPSNPFRCWKAYIRVRFSTTSFGLAETSPLHGTSGIRAAVEKRTSVYAFQRRVSTLPKHRYCMEPAASVPLLSSVPPCTRRCSAKDGSGSQQNRVCSGKLEVKK